MIAELRSTGCQTVFPGSRHPNGELIEWDSDGKPLAIEPNELLRNFNELCDAVLRNCGIDPSGTQEQSGHGSNGKSRVDLVERCWRYVQQMPDAISGNGGHDATFAAAATCFRFGLTYGEAGEILRRFNGRKTGLEQWTEKELAHKLADAREKVITAGEFGSIVNRSVGNVKTGKSTDQAGGEQPREPPRFTRLIDCRELLAMDPLYLSLLTPETAGDSGNVFAMGAALQPVSQMAAELGCTIIVLHHFRKNGQQNETDTVNLEELAQSGLTEWARQWILLRRRSTYQMDGRHEMYATIGGSAGHGGAPCVCCVTRSEARRVKKTGERYREQFHRQAA